MLRRELNRRRVAEEALATLAATDGLTKLFNRWRFDEALDLEQKRAVRNASSLSVLMIDVDFFKAFNDTYGHLDGDEALASIARVLRAAGRRPSDLIARFGGEEFVILLPDTDETGAVLVAETLRKSVHALGIAHAGSPSRVITISVGVACLVPGSDLSASELLRLSDDALYEAKARGRNRVVSTQTIETEWRRGLLTKASRWRLTLSKANRAPVRPDSRQNEWLEVAPASRSWSRRSRSKPSAGSMPSSR